MRLLKIGRDSSCDIVLNSDKVSSLHAEITLLDSGDILLEDKESRNGTFIMNHLIKPGTPVTIKRGDAIRFADVELIWNQVPMPEDNSNYKAVYGIGSNFRNDIQISGNTVSRFHATLKIDKKGRAYIIDHSKNGTTVNGQKIKSNRLVRIKRSDAIVCGGNPVNVKQFIRNDYAKIAQIAAMVVVLLGVGFGGYELFKYNTTTTTPEQTVINPATTQALENASVYVEGAFYFVIKFKDDPLKGYSGWSEYYYCGRNGISTSINSIAPYTYSGTAFFISPYGELGTNRHVAIPWEYEKTNYEDDIRDTMKEYVNNVISNNNLPEPKLIRLLTSDLIITGAHSYLGIALTGSKVNSILDLQQAQVIAESGDPEKDVALIRLNTRKTPDYIVNMGAIYDISQARVDETTLRPQDDNLIVVGYPLGTIVSDEMHEGKEMHPTIHRASISKVPDKNKMQIQTVGQKGQSGSPVSDAQHRLVGVLCSGFEGTEITYCCNIKHLVKLYNENKVKE